MRKFVFCAKGIILLILIIISIDYLGMIMATEEKVINLDKCGDVDIAFVGSSHVYRGINPQLFYDDTGMTSVNLSTSSQTIKGSYWLLKAFLKDHNPQIVFVDVMPANSGARDAFVLWPMHEWWILKHFAYHDLKNEEFDYNDASQFLAFRTKYDSIDKQDWAYLWGGGQLSSDHWYNAVYSGVTPYTEKDVEEAYVSLQDYNTEESLEYLNRIIDLSISEGFQLTFITAPYLISKDDDLFFSEVTKCSSERAIDFLNFNDKSEFADFDLSTDYADNGHLSYYGGEKYTKRLEEYTQRLGIKHDNNKEILRYWDDNANHYQITYDLRQNVKYNLSESLEIIGKMGNDYVQLFAITSKGFDELSNDEKKGLYDIGINPDFTRGKYCVILRKDGYIIYDYSDDAAELYKNIDGVTCSIKINSDGCTAAAGSGKVSMNLGNGIGIALYTISYNTIQLLFDCDNSGKENKC